MNKAILFDLDGTLANTDPLHYQTWKEILEDYGMEIDHKFYNTHISGRVNPLIIQDLLPQLSLQEGVHLAQYKEERFRDIALSLNPSEGLLDLLAWIDKLGLKKAVVTNAPRENAHFMLEVLQLTNRFDVVVLAEDATAGKPDPAPYKFVLNRLGIEAKDALTFEDSPSGIRSSVGAGICTIAVAATHDHEDLLTAGATMVIDDFTEPKLWQKLESFIPSINLE